MVNNSLYIYDKGRAYRPAFFFFILSFALSCSRADVPENDFVKYGLCAPAKGFSVFQAEGDFAVQGSNFSVSFNDNGRVAQLQHFFPDRTAGAFESYIYDSKDRLERIFLFDRDGGENGFYEYEYDGNIISRCTLYGKNTQALLRWEHENDGRRITKTTTIVEGELESVASSTFDGNERYETVYGPDGEAYLHNRYVYFDLTNRLVRSFENEDGTFSIEYNDRGLPEKSRDVFIDAAGDLYWRDDIRCDEILYEYEYDDSGNWTVRRQLCEGKVIETLVRTISY